MLTTLTKGAIALIFMGATASNLAAMTRTPTSVPCGPREELVEILTAEYGERIVAGGTEIDDAANDYNIELWISEELGTFSIVVTYLSSGLACLYTAGQDWSAGPVIRETDADAIENPFQN